MIIEKNQDISVDVVEGKTYFLCSCGLSKRGAFCEGSHRDTDLRPIKYIAEETTTIKLCGCSKSRSVPFCDGSQKKVA